MIIIPRDNNTTLQLFGALIFLQLLSKFAASIWNVSFPTFSLSIQDFNVEQILQC